MKEKSERKCVFFQCLLVLRVFFTHSTCTRVVRLDLQKMETRLRGLFFQPVAFIHAYNVCMEKNKVRLLSGRKGIRNGLFSALLLRVSTTRWLMFITPLASGSMYNIVYYRVYRTCTKYEQFLSCFLHFHRLRFCPQIHIHCAQATRRIERKYYTQVCAYNEQ